jgi:membrane-associated phospholipid phosphatase
MSLRNENHSFPSGHTTAAFALSTVLALRANNAFAAAGLYTAACMTAVQRVYGDDHWLSDAMFGATIGTACGIFTVRDSERTGRPATLSGIELTPLMTRSGAGIGITRRF